MAAESGEGEGATTSESSSSSSSSPSSTSDVSTSTPTEGKTTSAADNGDDRIMTSTLSALDALLGIDPEAEKKKKEQEEEEERRRQRQREEESSGGKPPISISVSPEVLKALAEAEAARNKNRESGGASSPASSTPEEKKKAEEAARKLQEELLEKLGADPASGPLRGLLLRSASPKDLAQIKEAAFGPRIFWVTETSPLDPFLADGWLIRGNLRSRTCAEALAHVTAEVAKLFGDKYTVLMIDDPGSADGSDSMEALMDEATGGMSRSPARQSGGSGEGKEGTKKKPEPRVAFQIVLSEAARPPPPPTWQPLAAAVLGALSLGSSVQLGMAANVFRLPPAILEWLADPAGLAAAPDGSLPPFVAEFDPGPFLASAVPIAAAVVAIQLAHEAGHLSVAFAKKFKIGLPLLVPNGQLGTFGAVTQLRSLAEDRQSLFDFAAAGPFAGGAVAAALFLAGLALSTGGGGGTREVVDAASSSLIPVPTALLHGSLLLGGLTQAVAGSGTLATGASVAGAAANLAAGGGAAVLMVHPLLVAGWAGLVTTALNLLPVGRLDGGRMVQAAFGRTPLAATSFFTYVGLALGFLGSALALPFGLYVLICQRDPENSPRDGVTEPSQGRQLAAAVAIGIALLVLLPAAPDVAGDTLNSGGMFL